LRFDRTREVFMPPDERTRQFTALSLTDLLFARDQFHVHLMHKTHVVGTAVGRYLVRKEAPKGNGPKPARTLENSEVREYSWPCVLVFVSEWIEEGDFGPGRRADYSDFIPQTIYLPDGRSVPICVVLAPLVESRPAPIDWAKLPFPSLQISPGYTVLTDAIQGMSRVASIGCMVSDGHKLYAVTSRHVAGREGEKLFTYLGNKKTQIGAASDLQLGHVSFQKAYDGWPGRNVFVNVDVGLIEITDARQWSPSIYGIGRLGPLADLSIYNLALNLIDKPVRASGAASGALFGKIAALFYRYKAVGGFEYVADLLIGSRDETPLVTHPGDSGTVWVTESDEVELDRAPIAVQWGGAVFSASAGATRMPFALATNLSTVCRELGVDLVRSSELATFEYWGAVGHYTIGSFACDQVQNASLRSLMQANRQRIAFKHEDITKKVNNVTLTTGVEGIKTARFIPLADVPDKVWKKFKTDKSPYGRKGPENPNHYADIDLATQGQKSLDEQTPNAKALKTQTWMAYYDAIGFTKISERGCLPFRVWQIYKNMVQFVAAKDVSSFVAAAGILAHYIGDASQPLHGSYLDDGDPFRNPHGSEAAQMLPHSHGYAAGVHMAYEDHMLDDKVSALLTRLDQALGAKHGMTLVTGGQEAGYAAIELMRRARKTIAPMKIVNAYGALGLPPKPNAAGQHLAADKLWTAFGTKTAKVMADGCKTLAMLWDSAWKEGKGHLIPASALVEVPPKTLRDIYEKQGFLKSVALNNIQPLL
jgi:hypothetical protein